MELRHPPTTLKYEPHYSSALSRINKRKPALWHTQLPAHSWRERGWCVASNIHLTTLCFSGRASWIDYILITNLMHWLLFIH